MNPSCFPGQFSVWQQGLDFSLRHSQAHWVPLISWEIRRVMPRQTGVFADCACTSLCPTMTKADLFSGKCSVTLNVTLEKNFMAAHGQLWHSQQWQFHCRLCAIAEPVWHPCLVACLKEAGTWFPAVLRHVRCSRFLCPRGNWICCWSSIHFARRSCGAISGNNHFSGRWGTASSQTKLREQE